MEGKKQLGSSSSSFTSELFGSKDLSVSASSPGILGSIFAPSTKVLGRESMHNEVMNKNQESTHQVWNTKHEDPDNSSQATETEGQSVPNREMNSIYQEERMQPCHLSSSIYYGGQDIYSRPQNSQSSGVNSNCKKDGGEDDAGTASRGNWWQGMSWSCM
ncbi:hypothetical protein RJ641_024686, partial [Dillenia turbinata]